MTDYKSVIFVEFPIVEGKLDEAFELLTEHDMGFKFTTGQPGFVRMDVVKDADKNSILLFQQWATKEDYEAYSALRQADDNEESKAFGEIFGPLLGGAPRTLIRDTLKTWKGDATVAEGADCCVSFAEFPIAEGKLDESVTALMENEERGIPYTARQPGFINMDVALDDEKNSVLVFGQWAKKEDFETYDATRHVENDENAAWMSTIGPLLGGAPRVVARYSLKTYRA